MRKLTFRWSNLPYSHTEWQSQNLNPRSSCSRGQIFNHLNSTQRNVTLLPGEFFFFFFFNFGQTYLLFRCWWRNTRSHCSFPYIQHPKENESASLKNRKLEAWTTEVSTNPCMHSFSKQIFSEEKTMLFSLPKRGIAFFAKVSYLLFSGSLIDK